MSNLVLAADLQEKVVQKIKASFVEFIPDLAWDELVEKEVAVFVEKDLKGLIKDELKLLFQANIKKELEKPGYVGGWNGSSWDGKSLPSRAVQQMLRELTPEFIAAMFGGIVQEATQRIRNNMANTY